MDGAARLGPNDAVGNEALSSLELAHPGQRLGAEDPVYRPDVVPHGVQELLQLAHRSTTSPHLDQPRASGERADRSERRLAASGRSAARLSRPQREVGVHIDAVRV